FSRHRTSRPAAVARAPDSVALIAALLERRVSTDGKRSLAMRHMDRQRCGRVRPAAEGPRGGAQVRRERSDAARHGARRATVVRSIADDGAGGTGHRAAEAEKATAIRAGTDSPVAGHRAAPERGVTRELGN